MDNSNTQAPASDTGVLIRDGRQGDWALLLTSFANIYSTRKSYYGYRVLPRILVDKLEAFLKHPEWKLITACDSSATDEIMGMVVYRATNAGQPYARPAIAWMTVKPVWQGKGIGRALLKATGIGPGQVDCAFMIPSVAQWMTDKGYTLRFRPYMPEVAMWEMIQRKMESHESHG